MFYLLVGNGCGETFYEQKLVEVKNATEEEVQAWTDTWVSQLEDNKKDCFGDLDPSKTSIEEIVDAMPAEWQASVHGGKGSLLFL